MENYIKARDYFLKRVADIQDPETARDEIQRAMNDAANFFASSFEEYQKIYDFLNNLAYTSAW